MTTSRMRWVVGALVVVVSAVSLSAGLNIPGVDIIVKKKPGGSVVKQGVSDANGKFEIGDLAAGKYSVTLAFPSLARQFSSVGDPHERFAIKEKGVQRIDITGVDRPSYKGKLLQVRADMQTARTTASGTTTFSLEGIAAKDAEAGVEIEFTAVPGVKVVLKGINTSRSNLKH